MKRILCAYLCIFSQLAFATGPVLWGPNSRSSNIAPQGFTLQSTVTIDSDGLNNFIKAASAETDVQISSWSTYADAAAATPADCTGGSANITWTRNTTTPLRGAADFKFTKDGSNRQGQGVAYAFATKPSETTGALLTVTAQVKSNEDAAYADSDLRFYVYDVTGAALITPTTVAILDGAYTYTSTFALTSTSSSYRLCVHVASTNASAYDVYLDDISVNIQGPVASSTETGLVTPGAQTMAGQKTFSGGLSSTFLLLSGRIQIGGSGQSTFPGFYAANAGNTTSCLTECQNTDALNGFGASSGTCLQAWTAVTVPIVCSDTSGNRFCLCMGLN